VNVDFSRRMGKLTVTSAWLAQSVDERIALIEDIERADSVGDLSIEHQELIARAEAEL